MSAAMAFRVNGKASLTAIGHLDINPGVESLDICYFTAFEQNNSSNCSNGNHEKRENWHHRPSTHEERTTLSDVLINHEICPAAMVTLHINEEKRYGDDDDDDEEEEL